MNYISNESVLSILSIGDWSVSEESMSGTIEWSNPKYSSVVYATPNWETDGVTPIAITYEDGDYDDIITFNLSGSISEQLHQYKTIVQSVLENL